jgi:lipoprotein-anchoring transpeptidase ErfK/SrfK
VRSPKLIIAILLLAVLGVAAATVHAYDRGRDDLIADGVRIGGVDVGGLRAGEARARVRAELLGPLQRPLLVRAGEQTFPLSAREARIRADVATMVQHAVRRSREGSLVQRTWRGLTGGSVHATVTPVVRYDRPAVQRLVDKVRVTMSRDPVDAKVDFSTRRLTIERARTGRTVDARRLRAAILREVVSPVGDREVRAPLERLAPKVGTAGVARRYPAVLTVDRAAHRIRLFEDLRETRSYPIALGQAGLETPAGLYTIQNKATNPAWHVPDSAWAGKLAGRTIPGGVPENPIKARWMGIYDGVGVHGTADRASIGTNASHGCIRMLVEDVEALYDRVPVGTPIYIS